MISGDGYALRQWFASAKQYIGKYILGRMKIEDVTMDQLQKDVIGAHKVGKCGHMTIFEFPVAQTKYFINVFGTSRQKMVLTWV